MVTEGDGVRCPHHRRRWGIQQIKWVKSEIYLNPTTGCGLYGVSSSAICSGFKVISTAFSSSSSCSSREVPIIGAAMPGLLNNQGQRNLCSCCTEFFTDAR